MPVRTKFLALVANRLYLRLRRRAGPRSWWRLLPLVGSLARHSKQRNSHGTSSTRSHGGSHQRKTHRDPAERRAFQHQHACPSTGRTSGACPGYLVDHVVALKRSGADRPSNMQCQTEAAKAKDKVE